MTKDPFFDAKLRHPAGKGLLGEEQALRLANEQPPAPKEPETGMTGETFIHTILGTLLGFATAVGMVIAL